MVKTLIFTRGKRKGHNGLLSARIALGYSRNAVNGNRYVVCKGVVVGLLICRLSFNYGTRVSLGLAQRHRSGTNIGRIGFGLVSF